LLERVQVSKGVFLRSWGRCSGGSCWLMMVVWIFQAFHRVGRLEVMELIECGGDNKVSNASLVCEGVRSAVRAQRAWRSLVIVG